MPLMAHSDFCSACGTAVRALAKQGRAAVHQGVAAPPSGAPPAPAAERTSSGEGEA